MLETRLNLLGIKNLRPNAYHEVKVPYDMDDQAVVVGLIKSSTLPESIIMRPFLIDISEDRITAGLADAGPLQVVPFFTDYAGEEPHRPAFEDVASDFSICLPTLDEIGAIARHDAEVDDIRTLTRFSEVVVDVALRKQLQHA